MYKFIYFINMLKWLALMNNGDFVSSLNILTQFKYVLYNGTLIVKVYLSFY